ncbi:MAG: chemotaxis protein CheW [Verrucomicrobiales bacterium]
MVNQQQNRGTTAEAVTQSYVLFEVAGSTYGVPSKIVKHIDMVEQITPVPNANASIDGVVFSRGEVVPALNLRSRFGFSKAELTLSSRIIFIRFQDRTVGLIVDRAREFRNIASAIIKPVEETLTGISGNYLKAVAHLENRLALLIDIEAVLNLNEAVVPGEMVPRSIAG